MRYYRAKLIDGEWYVVDDVDEVIDGPFENRAEARGEAIERAARDREQKAIHGEGVMKITRKQLRQLIESVLEEGQDIEAAIAQFPKAQSRFKKLSPADRKLAIDLAIGMHNQGSDVSMVMTFAEYTRAGLKKIFELNSDVSLVRQQHPAVEKAAHEIKSKLDEIRPQLDEIYRLASVLDAATFISIAIKP